MCRLGYLRLGETLDIELFPQYRHIGTKVSVGYPEHR
jgi:hypothetical protein